MQARRILIFTGGRLGEWALPLIQEDDYVIGADRGAYYLVSHQIRPNLAIGDFDSVTQAEMEFLRQECEHVEACDPIDKDFTDTELAFRYAMAQHPREIILIGALGTRFDHSLANIHLLKTAVDHNVPVSIVDEHNRVRVITDRLLLQKADEYAHVSLLPLTTEVTGIDLEGFRYPLQDATLKIGQSLGISNVIEAKEGSIRIRSGLLLVIESKD
ncbi:thiamine pyrophosphokinase [Paenibacillus phyllosphaerae]|uniref:Thiamine diphosphokinase n=1 Tax=Paenibacillus phyllosphaerae TaxID=274593 RepID=A0A7W5FMT1_9BACL|nr:thiamine diphosphokinase [Paenibacillus phyllosphaerae]MBB3110339.1 thiamine pyrophosphokinase [Paenibacillus phyllosphaerae]